MSAFRKAGDVAMKVTVVSLVVGTIGLVGSTFSQLSFLAQRRFGGGAAQKTLETPGGEAKSAGSS